MTVPAWLLYLLAMLALWVVAAGSFHPVQLAWGLLVATATLPLSWRVFGLGGRVRVRNLLRVFVGTIRVFLGSSLPDSLRSSFDMARRIIQPTVPMKPGIVAIPLRFRGSFDELVVSNHIMLTPGSLLVDIDTERGLVFVHHIDASDPARIRREMQELHLRAVRRLYP